MKNQYEIKYTYSKNPKRRVYHIVCNGLPLFGWDNLSKRTAQFGLCELNTIQNTKYNKEIKNVI